MLVLVLVLARVVGGSGGHGGRGGCGRGGGGAPARPYSLLVIGRPVSSVLEPLPAFNLCLQIESHDILSTLGSSELET